MDIGQENHVSTQQVEKHISVLDVVNGLKRLKDDKNTDK